MTSLASRFTIKQHRFYAFSLALWALAIALLSPHVRAQSAEDASYIGAIIGSDVYVRCGAAESYYPFAKVNDGDLVKVTGEKFDWVRVVTVGPAFQYSFGYIKHGKGDNGKFRLAADGKSGVTLGKTDIIAPNLDAKSNPKDSWKPIIRLEADQKLVVIKTTHTDKDTIHEVSLPESAQGWISKAYVNRASEEQSAQWNAKPAAKPTDAQKPVLANLPPSSSNSSSPSKPATINSEDETQPITASPEKVSMKGDERVESEGGSNSKNTPFNENDFSPDIDDSAESAGDNSESEKLPTTTKPTEVKKQPTLDDLESAYKQLLKEPLETAELTPLRELYMDLATRNIAEPRIARRATGRAEQLLIWSDLQQKRSELDTIRARTKMSAEETDAVRKALESSAEYVAVGRVAASTIYDGERLPKLLRLQDASTGRTIAYVKPDQEYELVNLIGNLIGVVGEKTYDETMRLNIVTPRRIDLLTPELRQAEVKTE